jgi:hypothetical protein
VPQKIRAFVEIHCKTRRLESKRTMNLAASPVGSTPVLDESSSGPSEMSLALSAALGAAAVGLTATRRASCSPWPADEAIALGQRCFSLALVFPAGREAPCR